MLSAREFFFGVQDQVNRFSRFLSEFSDKDLNATILHPATVRKGTVSKHLPGQLDRVTAVRWGADVKQEIEQFLGGERPIGPTIRYSLKNSIISRGVIYSGRKKKVISDISKRKELHGYIGSVDVVSIRSSFLGSYFFGDWLRDDCATTLIDDDGVKFYTPSPHWADKEIYLDLFEKRFPVAGLLLAKNVTFYDDKCQNDHKVARINALRDQLKSKNLCSDRPEVIYVRRGKDGAQRTLVNEEEIVNVLSKRGVTCISPDDAGKPIINRIYGCSLFISMGGSQVSHAIFGVRPNGGVLTLQQPDQFYNPHMDWAVPSGIQYGSVIGRTTQDGLIVPVEDILRAIDLFR
jgi:Glycosyltransferase 61